MRRGAGAADGGRTSTWRRPGKGIIATDDEAIAFQRVGARSQFTRLERTVDQSQIVVIGIPSTLDDDWLADRLG